MARVGLLQLSNGRLKIIIIVAISRNRGGMLVCLATSERIHNHLYQSKQGRNGGLFGNVAKDVRGP